MKNEKDVVLEVTSADNAAHIVASVAEHTAQTTTQICSTFTVDNGLLEKIVDFVFILRNFKLLNKVLFQQFVFQL